MNGVSTGRLQQRPASKAAPPARTEPATARPAHMDIQEAARVSTGVVLPSFVAYIALNLVPLCIWLTAVATGMLAFNGLPARRRDVRHWMLWFDVNVFRTMLGPALPFIVLLLRTAATWYPALSPGNKRRVQGTLCARAAAVYIVVTLGRVLLYTGHLLAQRQDSGSKLEHGGAAAAAQYMSDHVVLGASVVACLTVECVCAASDTVKLSVARTSDGLWRWCVAVLALAASVLCVLLVSADMHFTARHFHYPLETAVALLAGAALFQIPLLLWLRRQLVPVAALGRLHA